MKTFKQFITEKSLPDYSAYVKHTPADVPESRYYVLELPDSMTPPKKGTNILVNGIEVVTLKPMTPEDWSRGRGGPTAESMRRRGIGHSVNCLPVGHPDLENFRNLWAKE